MLLTLELISARPKLLFVVMTRTTLVMELKDRLITLPMVLWENPRTQLRVITVKMAATSSVMSGALRNVTIWF